ncbi:MAG TPA: tautomerase family protein [Trebonia sp.]
MPLWNIHHTPGIFTDKEKHQLASHIADHYEQAGLPRFYVVTVFHETLPEDFYVGGEPTSVGVRIAIDHIARRAADRESRRRNAQWIKGMLQPYLEPKVGLHWEFHIDETSDDLWMINGITPPPAGSAAEKLWAENNAAFLLTAPGGNAPDL